MECKIDISFFKVWKAENAFDAPKFRRRTDLLPERVDIDAYKVSSYIF